jgi:serine/threonine protein kinase
MIINKYQIEQKLGNGAFGSIYQGYNLRTKEKVAIKMEPNNSEQKSLKNETRIYQHLNGCQGIPNIRWFGADSTSNYMVIDLLGPSLTDMIKKQGKVSLQTIVKLGIQMIDILQGIHDKGMIHRDLKPDNLLLHPTEGFDKIYIIDFGVCKTYLQYDKNEHIEMRKTSAMIGTPNFASLNAHHLLELSRRDDLESFVYTLLFLYLRNLRWTYPQNTSREEMMKMKMELVENPNPEIPTIFIEILKCVRKLEFKQRPFYEKYKKMFQDLL